MPVPDALLRFERIHSDELTLSLHVARRSQNGSDRGDWPLLLLRALNEIGRSIASAPPDERDAFERCASRAVDFVAAVDLPRDARGVVCYVCAGGAHYSAPVAESQPTSARWGLGLALRDAWAHAIPA